MALGRLQLYEEEIEVLEQAIAINSWDAAFWYNMGIALSGLHRYEETAEAYERAVEIDPEYASAWYNKGNTMMRLKRYEDALADYNRRLRLTRSMPLRGITREWHFRGLTGQMRR